MAHDWYLLAKDFAGPSATAFAALTAAAVTGAFAYRQWKTADMQAKIALDKLKLEAIGDRIDVLEATRELIKYVVNLRHDDAPDTKEMQKLRYRTLKGRFIFKSSIYSQIEKVIDECFEVPNYVPELRREDFDESQIEAVRKRGKAKVFVIKIRDKLPIILENEISLSLFKEESGYNEELYSKKITVAYLILFVLIFFMFCAFGVALLVAA